MAGGKTVIVASSRGGLYSTCERGRATEYQESHLQTVFGFCTITDVRFLRAEGLGLRPDARETTLTSAAHDVRHHMRPLAANESRVAQVA